MSVAQKKVAVIGQGYVGLPLAVRVAEAGYDVVGLDVDEIRVKGLASGDSLAEDVPSHRLMAALNSGRYLLSTYAHVLAREPHVAPLRLLGNTLCVELTEEQVAAADAVVIATDHDVVDYAMVERVSDYLFDACNRCHADNVERL